MSSSTMGSSHTTSQGANRRWLRGALAKRVEALPKEIPDLAGITAQVRQIGDKAAALERRLNELAQSRPGESDLKPALDRLAADSRAAAERLGAEIERLKREMGALQPRVAVMNNPTIAIPQSRLGRMSGNSRTPKRPKLAAIGNTAVRRSDQCDVPSVGPCASQPRAAAA